MVRFSPGLTNKATLLIVQLLINKQLFTVFSV